MPLSKGEKIWGALAIFAGALYLLSRTNMGQSFTGAFFDKLAALLTRHEGKRLSVYQDEAGLWTVGIGHLVKATDHVIRDGGLRQIHPYGPVRELTDAEVDALFRADTEAARNAVSNKVSVPLNDNQRAALVSLVFNIGAGAFSTSTLLRELNAGHYIAAADQFLPWNKITVKGAKVASAGLTSRRASERALFLS